MIDIVCNYDGDLLLTNGDITLGGSTEQHKADLLISSQGDYSEHPAVGVGSFDSLLDDNPSLYVRSVTNAMQGDGMRVEAVYFDTNNNLIIDAEYDTNQG